MEKDCFEKYAIEQMRLQRHDFMNYLQVIYGYIQINKPQEAVKYIKNINKYMLVIGRVFNLECDAFGIIFQEFVNKCIIRKIQIELDLRIEYISCENFSKDIDKKRRLFNAATDKLLEMIDFLEGFNQKLYIYFDGLPESLDIIISSAEISNCENYFSNSSSESPWGKLEEENEAIIFCKKDGIAALKLNFN